MTTTPVGPGYRFQTDPHATDPRMRGRRYAIPFDHVWTAATKLASGDMPGWGLTWHDDREGVIEARTTKRFMNPEGLVRIRIFLDADAQTCVAMSAGPASGGRDLGASRRRIRRFYSALDERLAPRPGQLLPPTPAGR